MEGMANSSDYSLSDFLVKKDKMKRNEKILYLLELRKSESMNERVVNRDQTNNEDIESKQIQQQVRQDFDILFDYSFIN